MLGWLLGSRKPPETTSPTTTILAGFKVWFIGFKAKLGFVSFRVISALTLGHAWALGSFIGFTR